VDLELLDQASNSLTGILYQALAQMDDPLAAGVVETANIVSKVYFGRARIHMLLGQVHRGQLAAEGITPDEAAAKHAFDLAVEQYELVIQDYRAGDELARDLAGQAYAGQGQVAILQGDFARAASRFKEAVALTSPFYQGQFAAFLGYAYIQEEQLDEACRALQDSIDYAGAAGDERTVRLAGFYLDNLEIRLAEKGEKCR
jgi:tetratricopeptide (TPR) repeat protein